MVWPIATGLANQTLQDRAGLTTEITSDFDIVDIAGEWQRTLNKKAPVPRRSCRTLHLWLRRS